MSGPSYSITANQIILQLNLAKDSNVPLWESDTQFVVVEEEIENDIKKLKVQFQIDKTQTQLNLITSNYLQNNNQTIKITDIWVNNIKINIDGIATAFKFYPSYTNKELAIAKLKKQDLPTIIENYNNIISNNGEWVFQFDQPFFVWYKLIIDAHPLINSLTINKKTDIFGKLTNEQLSRVEFIIKELAK